MDSERVPPGPGASVFLGFGVVFAIVAAQVDLGSGFHPRDKTIDAIAGLAIGSFLIDRLLTFVPVFAVRKAPRQRAADLDWLRLAWGAILAAVFVSLTDLRAIEVLSAGPQTGVDARWDRLVAIVAIAGGVAGLARLLAGINPPKPTDGAKSRARKPAAEDRAIPPPTVRARAIGIACVAAGAVIALAKLTDRDGLQLLVPETGADGTIAVGLRFGVVIVAAAIVEQVLERTLAPLIAKNDKPLIVGGVAVALGVLMARAFDLYLLHNIGFFGDPGETFTHALATSPKLAHWADTFLTGVAIAAGTKPLHDLSSRLRKAKAKAPKPA